MYQHWNEYGCLEFKVFVLIFTLGIAEFDFDFAFYFIFWGYSRSHNTWRLIRKKISKECDAMLFI